MSRKRLHRVVVILLLPGLLLGAVAGLGLHIVQAQSSYGVTSLVSLSSDGVQGDQRSMYPVISDDGRYVAFESLTSNLVAGDTNNTWDIFLRDRQTRQTWRVSVASDGAQANGLSWDTAISGDGRYVAFISDATNLVAGDTNNDPDIFVHDMQTGETRRVSVAADGSQGDDDSLYASVSSDGCCVAFTSFAGNLVPGDNNEQGDVFVYALQTGEITLVSVASDGTQGNDVSASPSISADGRFVAFVSLASNLDPLENGNLYDIYVHDRQTGETRLVSLSSEGIPANGWCNKPFISADGRYVAFGSEADNLVVNDTNLEYDVFVRDLQIGETTRVSVATDGAQAIGINSSPAISADGRYVVFYSNAANLVSDDTNGMWDSFLHDRLTGETKRISVAINGEQGNRGSYHPYISADGCCIAHHAEANNLVPNDTNGRVDIFVYDQFAPVYWLFAPLVMNDP